jgi:hypothetical protein
MKAGQLIRRSPHPAPVGRPDFYKRELHPSLLIRSGNTLPTRNFLSGDVREPQAVDIGRECVKRYGYYPLNFSFPRPDLMPELSGPRPHFLSSTIPGEPFSFDSWVEYLAEYQSSYWALSTRKGGWDTFRHLEILFSGAIPLMPRLEKSQRFSLAHFPKRALVQVLRSLIEDGPALPDEATRDFFWNHAHTRLTSVAMATYLLEAASLGSGRLLFLDRDLPHRSDYLSLFTLIGLLQAKGTEVVTAFEPAYLFDDYQGDTAKLYGRGFGFSKVLSSSLRSRESLKPDATSAEIAALSETCDSIVVGNFDSNRTLVGELRAHGVPEHKFVCVVGSDLVPDFSLRRGIKSSAMTFFVREF